LEHCSGYGVPVLFSCMCGQPSLWITFSSQKNLLSSIDDWIFQVLCRKLRVNNFYWYQEKRNLFHESCLCTRSLLVKS
jgi:hypothetical protein